MSSAVSAGLWAAFSAGLLLGLWAEAAEQRSPWRFEASRWVPAALGFLRGELVVLLGLMVLLVLRPVSWVPFVALAVVAAWVGRFRFLQVVRRRRRWWSAAGAVLAGSWPAVVAVFLEASASLGVRAMAAYAVMLLAGGVFSTARFVAGVVAGVGACRPSEYAAVTAMSSRA